MKNYNCEVSGKQQDKPDSEGLMPHAGREGAEKFGLLGGTGA